VWQERKPHGPTLRRHEAEVLEFLQARVKNWSAVEAQAS
jgi:hypothetical protein